MSEYLLDLPVSPVLARSLKLGDTVFLRGDAVITAGYPTHQRLLDCVEEGRMPPVSMDGGAFFHLGCMSREEDGALRPLYVNPTTSTRFNAFMPHIITHFGLTVVGGKGGLDAESVAAMKKAGCVYLSILGGGAPLLTEGIEAVCETGWNDLIVQFRLSRVRLDTFGPLTVAIDAHGNSVYADLSASAEARLPDIMRELARDRSIQL
ncbi:fumarate hydratase C-terminal domain-containing protein [Martelella soudanensis]|uniref:fumarate hydratase C-terminal domain-containing protein n=1 Tax=unclassified Martelella TaxID=2629616 RepID=UPI0015DDD1CC|nr:MULTISPECIES: fumarate hydratase C-terminal domain-containing protein [unclassified Martelella]